MIAAKDDNHNTVNNNNTNKHRSVSFKEDHANDDENDDDDVESSFNTGTIASSSIDAQHYDQNMSAKEDRWVCGLRVLTCVLLMGVAIVVCLVVYLTQRQSEREQYQQEFDNLADKLRSSFETSVQQRFQVLAAFADSLTAESLALANAAAAESATNGTDSTSAGTWPFFSPHDFSDRFERVAQLAQVMAVHMLWKVERHQLEEWNRYSVENSAWRFQGISKQRNIPLEQVYANTTDYVPYLYDPYSNPSENIPAELSRPQGPYWPIWMSYPVSDYAIANLDLYHDWEHIYPINKTQQTGKTVLEYTYDYKGHIEKEGDIRYDFISENKFIDYQDDPHGSALVPVFDSFDDENKQVVAQLFVYIYWRQYFDGLLPPGADGIIVVLSNSCDQVYTYQIDGSKSWWLGRGDLHDPRYDHINVSTSINQILVQGKSDSNNNTQEFADDTESDILYYDCFYNIKVYPSQEFENSYYTSRPWVQATILASLFLFTSTVFISYDRLVERRQQLVLKAAIEARKEIRKQELKDEFLAIMAHEIRTPLHQVTGFVDLLDQTSLDVEQKSFVGVLKTSVQGLMTVINDVLDYSKLEAGHMKLENIPYEPLAVTRGSMEAVRKGCDERGLYLHLDWDTRIPFKLNNDPNRLRQILLNLLSNSVKFTKKGGITVKAIYQSNEADHTDKTSVISNYSDHRHQNGDDATTKADDNSNNTNQEPQQHPQQPMIKFIISDTGIGISEQHRKIIFKKYQQANATIARNYGGTGLGLSICHSLVSMMGGSMGVDSILGRGTDFWFVLPAVTPTEKDLAGEDMLEDEEMALLLSPVVVPADPSCSNGDADAPREVQQSNDVAQAAQQQPPFQSAAVASNGTQGDSDSKSGPVKSSPVATSPENNGLNVLVVEDNKVNQKLLLNMLRRLGHTASVAENGKEAIDTIAAGDPDQFDLCLMDIQMPVCDGYEATKRLRSMGYTDLPIYGLTASMGRSDFVELGFDDWLPKPIRMKDLKTKLYQLWKQQQHQRQHPQQEREASISSERKSDSGAFNI